MPIPHPLPEPLVELVAQRFRLIGEPMRIRLLDRLRDGEPERRRARRGARRDAAERLQAPRRAPPGRHRQPAQGRQPRRLRDRRPDRVRALRDGLRRPPAAGRRARAAARGPARAPRERAMMRALADRVVPGLAARPPAPHRARRHLRRSPGAGRQGRSRRAARTRPAPTSIPALVLDDGTAVDRRGRDPSPGSTRTSPEPAGAEAHRAKAAKVRRRALQEAADELLADPIVHTPKRWRSPDDHDVEVGAPARPTTRPRPPGRSSGSCSRWRAPSRSLRRCSPPRSARGGCCSRRSSASTSSRSSRSATASRRSSCAGCSASSAGASDERLHAPARPGRPPRPLRRDARPRSSRSPGSSSPSASASSRRASRPRSRAPAGRRPGRDSVAARSLIQQQFAGNASSGLMIVLHSPSLTATDPAFAAAADKVAAMVKADPAVASVTPPVAGRLDLPGRAHRDRDGAAPRAHPKRDGARRRPPEGSAQEARQRRRHRQPHRRVGHVVRLQRRQPLRDDEVASSSPGRSRSRSSRSRSARWSPPACR